MSNVNPWSNNTGVVRYGPFPVDFITDTNVQLGSIQYDQERLIVQSAWVDFINVNGTLSQNAIATVDDATTGETVGSSLTFSAAATDKAYGFVIPNPFYVITGNATTAYPRLHITQNAIGQATTLRERTDNIATVTTAAVHGLNPGDITRVASMTDDSYDGLVQVITTPTTSSITYYSAGADEASTADTAGRVGAVQAEVSIIGYLREEKQP